MKWVLRVVGGLALLLGLIWILQGINVLPGSFMTGDMQWAYRGGAVVVIGVVLLVVAHRLKSPSK